MSRKLASIQIINELNPIEGKDKIVLATLGNGWKVIVQKETYHINDQVVYFEIDSILPDIPMFEFIKKRSNNMRIRTMKMSGVISQGLCITIPEAQAVAKELGTVLPENLKLNTDLTEVLKVGKYEEDEINRVTTSNQKYNKFEKFMLRFAWYRWFDKKFINPKGPAETWPDIGLEKTDEERWQNKTAEIADWRRRGLKFWRTVKMDGQSATFILNKVIKKKFFGLLKKSEYEFIVCSRNRRLNPKSNSNDKRFFATATKYNIKSALEELMNYGCSLALDDKCICPLSKIEWVAIQGEQCGPGINGNRIGLQEDKLFVFNWKFKTADGQIHTVNPHKYRGYLQGACGLELVPIAGEEDVLPEDFDRDSFGYYDEEHKRLREGVVYRNYEEGISFKAVSPEYLAKNNC